MDNAIVALNHSDRTCKNDLSDVADSQEPFRALTDLAMRLIDHASPSRFLPERICTMPVTSRRVRWHSISKTAHITFVCHWPCPAFSDSVFGELPYINITAFPDYPRSDGLLPLRDVSFGWSEFESPLSISPSPGQASAISSFKGQGLTCLLCFIVLTFSRLRRHQPQSLLSSFAESSSSLSPSTSPSSPSSSLLALSARPGVSDRWARNERYELRVSASLICRLVR